MFYNDLETSEIDDNDKKLDFFREEIHFKLSEISRSNSKIRGEGEGGSIFSDKRRENDLLIEIVGTFCKIKKSDKHSVFRRTKMYLFSGTSERKNTIHSIFCD